MVQPTVILQRRLRDDEMVELPSQQPAPAEQLLWIDNAVRLADYSLEIVQSGGHRPAEPLTAALERQESDDLTSPLQDGDLDVAPDRRDGLCKLGSKEWAVEQWIRFLNLRPADELFARQLARPNSRDPQRRRRSAGAALNAG